ncbi:uncharacterized protein LOC129762252 isoform X2 [Toxorhynchites rutilus septentrionalis]|uniref:uncharacterized protein LOC129762252 isoform X2 n=1 Tax=Toxorhynchites rutilus septentrionalis TaxID=329112 RepID=UPI00247A247D|nr:uncharacterized protein LOC129762252 isoform X2 [Toxorhynchites rutilus septentrionalis]
MDQLLNPEACLVLQAHDEHSFCEQALSVSPVYQISKLALIAECCKIESYVGQAQEYSQTHHGELFYDSDSQLYLFDIRLENCSISNILLRFVLPPDKVLCLYGMHIVLAKRSSPMSIFDNQNTIRRAMIECRLDDSKLSESAAKCKAFMLASMDRYGTQTNAQQKQHMFNNNNTTPNPSSTSSSGVINDLSSQSSHIGDHQAGAECIDNSETSSEPPFLRPSSSLSEMLVKQYIDSKFLDFERMIDSKLRAMELRQNEKLDKIISVIESINRK